MKKKLCFGVCSLFTAISQSYAADTADLAKQLSNPVAAMVSVTRRPPRLICFWSISLITRNWLGSMSITCVGCQSFQHQKVYKPTDRLPRLLSLLLALHLRCVREHLVPHALSVYGRNRHTHPHLRTLDREGRVLL